MGIRCFLFVLCGLFSSVVLADDLFLKEKLQEATPGSYLVLYADKTFTFFHIYENTGDRLIIEEVTLPAPLKPQIAWKDWFMQGAPHHTSWTMTQLNLMNGTIDEMYSFSRRGWLDPSEADRFIHTLLFLRFHEVPDQYRRCLKDGLPWSPPLIVDGTPLPQIPFRAWKSRWPNDRSELARQVLEIYLPIESEEGIYPTFFPYWIEVNNKLGHCRLRVVDGGFGVISPMPHLPYRSLEVLGSKIDKDGLKLKVSSPSYYKEFLLIAEEEAPMGKAFLLPCEIWSSEKEKVILFVPTEALENQMNKGDQYTITVSPKENAAARAKSPLPVALN